MCCVCKQNIMSTSSGYIYIIITREFLKQNESVFKVGTTKDMIQRFHAYPKGSVLLYNRFVHDATGKETLVLKVLRDEYIHRKDIGREYFEGNVNNIIATVNENLQEPLELFFTQNNKEDDNNKNVKPRVIDPDAIITRFYEENKHQFQYMMKSALVYDMFTSWILANQAKIGRTLSQRRLTSGLKELFGANVKVMRVGEDVAQVMYLPGISPPSLINTHYSLASKKLKMMDYLLKFLKEKHSKYVVDNEEKKSEYISSLVSDLKGFLKNTVNLKDDEIDSFTTAMIGRMLTDICNESNGALSKIGSCGPKRVRAYCFNIHKLGEYLKISS